MDKFIDYIKAVRKGSRDATLDSEHGWKSVNKIHSSKKNYNRKKKHKGSKITDEHGEN